MRSYHPTKLLIMTSGIFMFVVLMTCTDQPRRVETVSGRGERHVVVNAPSKAASDLSSLRLVLIRKLTIDSLKIDPPIGYITGLSSDGEGRLFISDRTQGHIVVLDTLGNHLGSIGQEGPGPFEFRKGTYMAQPLAWMPGSQVLAVLEFMKAIIFFDSSGLPLPQRIVWYGRPHRPTLSARNDGIVTLIADTKPIVEYSTNGQLTYQYGRCLEPEDAAWPEVAEFIRRKENTQLGRYLEVPHEARRPWNIAAVGESLAVHEVPYRNSYRCWNRFTEEMEWQLDLMVPDWEAPSLIGYRTSGQTNIISWSRSDPPEVVRKNWVRCLKTVDGHLFSVSLLRGNSRRIKPDRVRVTSPGSLNSEFWAGLEERGIVDVFSLKPDLVASIPFEVDEDFLADILRGPILVLAFNEPILEIVMYSVEGLQ